jgi:hypothetical protein
MLMDYYGTLLGAITIKRGYSDHFGMEHYEMNPVWQDSVAGVKWFNPRHLALTAGITAGAVVLLELAPYPDSLSRGLVGAVLGMYALLVGRHVSNIMTFLYVAGHRPEVSGTVAITHPAMLAMSAFQLAAVVVPLALVAAVTGNAYAIGAAFGAAGLTISHLAWLRKARRATEARERQPDATD